MQNDLALLIRQLQGAHAGELAASYAYRGHANSVRDAKERAEIEAIRDEELHHRKLVADMLARLGAKPNPVREAIFFAIGKSIAAFCHIGGWFIPMYGAGRLERSNIVEYEDAALYASRCGHEELIDCLLSMAEVEWEHERYFREKVAGHLLLRVFKVWPAPAPKETIRARFARAA
jgi:rubrerythrin